VVACVSLHPVLVIVGSLGENFLAHRWNPEDLANEVDHLFGAGKPVEVAVDHDTVEAVIYKNKKIAEQLSERVPGDISHRKEKHRRAEERSDDDRAKQPLRARSFASPKKSITFRTAPPNATVVS
jgi:hypothetical protein